MATNKNLHFLVVTFPAQGHINPSLQFAKRLIRTGAQVTFSTSLFGHRKMINSSTTTTLDGLTLAPFSDGFDDGVDPTSDNYLSQFKSRSSESIRNIILELSNVGRPVTSLIYTLCLQWVGEVARELDIPSTLLWIQPATTFDIYHYYFDGYRNMINDNVHDPLRLIQLPGLPPLTCQDIPSFLLPASLNPHAFLSQFYEQFQFLKQERYKEKSPLTVLVNTFDALEPETLTAVADKYNLIGIGPLIPSDFLDSNPQSNTSVGVDLLDGSKENYIEWLNSKEEASVVYVSFGRMATLAKKQTEEIARGLVESGRPFLWVIRTSDSEVDKQKLDMVLQLIGEQGVIVPWCSQVVVLNHPSVGCFVMHGGWSSTLESLMAGVPMVVFPQWADQGTNAKLIKDVCTTGVRVKANEKDKILESEQLKRCLEMVMGEQGKGKEVRMNAKKWKDLTRKAVEEGGSLDRNLHTFVQEVSRGT